MKEIDPTQFVILIVDDNPKNIQVLGSTLKAESFKVEFATNGIKALDWLKKKKFDIVLLDVMMPDMDGFETCTRMREDEKTKEIPVIFLTAKTDRESILKGFELGAQDYVTKPFEAKELLARVKTQLELKSKKEELEKVNQWLGKKIDRWLKQSVSDKDADDAIGTKLDMFDKETAATLKDINLDLVTAIKEITVLRDNVFDSNVTNELDAIIKRLSDSVDRLV